MFIFSDFKCGENIFLSNFKVPWDVVVNSWYSEKDDFKYGYGPISDRETGHYTQVGALQTRNFI